TPEAAVVSSSPELYLSLHADGRVESRPIKGTRPRHEDPVRDAALRDDLAASAKDRAENVMIVDLVRNDLGRVCGTGSVRVPELCAVEGYATVWQLVSTVTGRLRPGLDALDLLRACHPPGSMTGAPKIEALKVIDERETCRRGVYAGGLGWWDDGGALDLHVVIRTAAARGGVIRFGVGGAVTADSDPHAEYLESMDKARALIRAAGLANAGYSAE
ncbi:anthranilate synthase component I family protein, partial [bacterium]|nr:anthranilate synthase component I family protein [bacterium]